MNKQDVLKIILDEKIHVDNITGRDDLTKWFWKVGFRDIQIDGNHITCIVSRPNQFISKYQKKIRNFLIHLSKVFIKKGYTFEIKKYTEDEYYNMYLSYLDEVNL